MMKSGANAQVKLPIQKGKDAKEEREVYAVTKCRRITS
jgi:hypothetical protein